MIQKICPFCLDTFDGDLIKDHIGIHHLGLHSSGAIQPKKKFSEDEENGQECTQKYSEFDLKVPGKYIFACEECGKQFPTERAYNIHGIIVHDHNFVFAGPAPRKKDVVKQEPETKHRKVKCDHCPQEFRLKRSYRQHLLKVHKGAKFQCEFCPKSFSNKTNRDEHISAAHKGVKYECSQCNDKFTFKRSMKRHIETVHEKIKNYHCAHCDKAFSTSHAKKTHVKSVHEKIKDLQCDQCDKRFASTSILIGHKETHSDTQYKCELCNDWLSSKSSLKRHMQLRHPKEEIIRSNCNFCDKTFARIQGLKIHIKSVHEKKRDLQCPHCPKRFSSSSDLSQHKKVVHREVRLREGYYKCQKCPKTYLRKASLNNHSRSSHE